MLLPDFVWAIVLHGHPIIRLTRYPLEMDTSSPISLVDLVVAAAVCNLQTGSLHHVP
jgi:hypothetical protein